MKTITSMIFGVLLVLATNIQATETEHWTDINSLLEHNERLINETVIGSDLTTSTNEQATVLFIQAKDQLQEAREAYKLGDYRTAKDLSLKSINAVYAADKALYNLQ